MRFMWFAVDLILGHNKVPNREKTLTHGTFDATSMNDVIFHFKLLHLIDFGSTHSTIFCFELDKWRMFFFCFLILRCCGVGFLFRRKNTSSCPERRQVGLCIFGSITSSMYFTICGFFTRHFYTAIRHWCRVLCFLQMQTLHHHIGHQQDTILLFKMFRLNFLGGFSVE